MTNKEKQEKIEEFLTILKKNVKDSDIYNHPAFKSFIIAGSYADWKKNKNGMSAPSWKSVPDINLYLIIDGSNKEHLEISTNLAKIYSNLANKLEFNLLLDLHPFYKSYSDIKENKFNLQLTTRVINANQISAYPDYCWFGWKSNYIELCSKSKNYLDNLNIQNPKRDLRWLKYMYMAFSSYNNAVHMAVLSSMFETNEIVFDEIYRYLKEIIKDGMSLAVPIEQNFNYLDIKKWKKSLPEFYEQYYNKEAKEIIKNLEYYEQNYFECRKNVSINKIASQFAVLFEIIYKKGFMERKKQLAKEYKNDDFVIPMWY